LRKAPQAIGVGKEPAVKSEPPHPASDARHGRDTLPIYRPAPSRARISYDPSFVAEVRVHGWGGLWTSPPGRAEIPGSFLAFRLTMGWQRPDL